MDRLREMEVFVAIVDRGSFTGASEKLGMSAAAVSRALNSLEARLGAQLLARTTRSVRPTDAGMAYLDACRKVLDAITDAEANIAAYHVNPVGTLTISAPVLFGQRYHRSARECLCAALSGRQHQCRIHRPHHATSRGRRGYRHSYRPSGRLHDICRSVGFRAASNVRGARLSRGAWGTCSSQGPCRPPLRVLHGRDASARVGRLVRTVRGCRCGFSHG